MPRIVVAVAEDTLCGIARANGYPDCTRLRGDAANAAYLNRDLVPGDRVTVPDMTIIERARGVTDRHIFRRPGVPLPGLRIIHGLPDATDPTTQAETRHLNICNYQSDLTGANPLVLHPNGFGHNTDADLDPDSFKIEVRGVVTGTASVNVTMEALKPVYAGVSATPTSWITFPAADANAGLRSVIVACERMTNFQLMQSRYLRLAADEADFEALSGNPKRTDGTAQGLYVSDLADGNDGDNDKVEILDQKVRFSYEVHNCPAAATQQKCTIRKTLEVGPRRQRLKVAFHIYRSAVGGAAIGGVTEQIVRQRVRRWVRRLYASSEIAPKFVAGGIEFLDPPGANMLVISNKSGRRSSGVTSTGGASKITFRLSPVPPPGGWPGAAPAASNVTVNLARNLTPKQVGDRIAAALPATYQAEVAENATCLGQPRGSCDILIRRVDGTRVAIRNLATDDTTLSRASRVRVVRVDLSQVPTEADFNDRSAGEIKARRIIRESGGAADQFDFYIIDQFVSAGTGAYALFPFTDWPAAHQSRDPVSRAALVATGGSGNRVDLTDQFFSVLAHEGGHALMEIWHANNADPNYTTNLMYNFESSTDNPDVDKRKRMYDGAVQVNMETPTAASPWWAVQAITMTDRFRTRAAPCLEAW